MERHKLGNVSIVTMQFFSEILNVKADPVSTPVIYTDVGIDLNGVPIEAGFGTATWIWDTLSQDDYDRLLDLVGDVAGSVVYVRSSKFAGESGITFANYNAVSRRPQFERREGLVCYNVKIELLQMLEV